MKKIFAIISGAISGVLILFIICMCFIKVNIKIDKGAPKTIYLYNKSTAATTSSGYESGSAEYKKIMKDLEKLTNISIFNRLNNKTKLNDKIQIDTSGNFAKWTTDLKQSNIVIELIYDTQQDVVVYDNGKSRVISYWCISYVIPTTKKFADVVAYYSTTNDSTKKDSFYASCMPLNFKGMAGKLMKDLKTIV